jgi:hypothetical protein
MKCKVLVSRNAWQVMEDFLVLNEIKPKASEFKRLMIESSEPFSVGKMGKRWNTFSIATLDALELVYEIFFSRIPDYGVVFKYRSDMRGESLAHKR